jgi:hypothetical protein
VADAKLRARQPFERKQIVNVLCWSDLRFVKSFDRTGKEGDDGSRSEKLASLRSVVGLELYPPRPFRQSSALDAENRTPRNEMHLDKGKEQIIFFK